MPHLSRKFFTKELQYVLKTCRWNFELPSCKIVFKCVLSNAFISDWNEYANTLPACSIYANNKPFPSCSLPLVES